MCMAFPRSEYYQRVRLPPSLLSPSGWSIRLTYSACFPGRDGSGSPRCHDASISVHAVLLDPAGVSSDLRLCGRLLLPSRFSTLSASGYVTWLNRFTCVTAWTSLCLCLTHVVTFMSPRLDSRWVGSSLSGAGVSPAESAGLNLAHQRISPNPSPPPNGSRRRYAAAPLAPPDAPSAWVGTHSCVRKMSGPICVAVPALPLAG
jgi:hypothetical protein